MHTFETIDRDQLAGVAGGTFDFGAIMRTGLMGAMQGGIMGFAQGAIDALAPYIQSLFGGQQLAQPQQQPEVPEQAAAESGSAG